MKKILVIEDNFEVRENVSEILELSGYKVFTAENGKTGVELALQEKPDLVVCDIMMPVLDGFGVLHLLGKHEETANIPFLFLTAKSEKADFRKGMEMGADDYLTKPFDGIELLNAVDIRLKKAESLKQFLLVNAASVNHFLKEAGQSEAIQLVSEEREVYQYKKKHALYAEGQHPKAVYFIVSGKIKMYRINSDGKELITGILGPGDFLGYSAILEESNYKDNAEVLEEAELMLIPKQDFLQLITNDPKISKQFIRIITKDILEKEEALLNLAYNSLRKKVAYGLIQLADKYKEEGKKETVLNISRNNIAQSIGVATESLIRTLSDFKEEGLIEIESSKIIILDEKKLASLPY